MEIKYLSIFSEKMEIVSTEDNEDYNENIKKIINSLSKDILKPVIIKKNDVYICLKNIKINKKYIFFVCASKENNNQKLMNNLIENTFNQFNNDYLNDFENKLNDPEFILNLKKNLLNNQIIKSNKEFEIINSKMKQINKNLEESTEITKINLNKFIERQENLLELGTNSQLLEQTAIKFQVDTNNLKKYYLIQKYRIYIIVSVAVMILFLMFKL